MPPLKDLTGKKFGHLTVIKREGTYISPGGCAIPTWLCKCDCGNTTIVPRGSLINGYTKSCGCQHFIHEFNDTREIGNVVYIKVKDKEVLVDKEDLKKITPNRIWLNSRNYPMVGKGTLLSRLLMGCPNEKVVDHINHNTLDNRKCNLRVVTQKQNMKNAKAYSNTGELGISKCKDGYYRINLDKHYIGIAKTLEEAIEKRNEYLPQSDHYKYNFYLNDIEVETPAKAKET